MQVMQYPLRFSTQPNGTHANGVEYTEGVTYGNEGKQKLTQIVVGANAPGFILLLFKSFWHGVNG